MHREYAIEPTVFGDWNLLRLLVGQLGWEHGRLISEIPGSWVRQVFEAAAAQGRQGTRVEECVRRLKPGLVVRRDRAQAQREGWLDQVRALHEVRAFDLIVTREANDTRRSEVPAGELDTSAEYWRVGEGVALRDPASIARELGLLLRCAREVRFVDPYLLPGDRQYKDLLQALLQLAADKTYRQGCPVVEIHTKLKKRDGETYSHLREEYEAKLLPLVPRGIEVKVVIWCERDGGQQFHNRYVLTDRGGVSFGSGIAAAPRRESFDDLARLTESARAKWWRQYDARSSDFEPAGPVFTVGGNDQPRSPQRGDGRAAARPRYTKP